MDSSSEPAAAELRFSSASVPLDLTDSGPGGAGAGMIASPLREVNSVDTEKLTTGPLRAPAPLSPIRSGVLVDSIDSREQSPNSVTRERQIEEVVDRRMHEHLAMMASTVYPTPADLTAALAHQRMLSGGAPHQASAHVSLSSGPSHRTEFSTKEIVQLVNDYELAQCSLDSYFGLPGSSVAKVGGIHGPAVEMDRYGEVFEDDRLGIRCCVYARRNVRRLLGSGKSLSAMVFAFRGTDGGQGRDLIVKNIAADWRLFQDPDKEILVEKSARLFVQSRMREAEALYPLEEWVFYTCGHSLGGFLACSCAVQIPRVDRCVSFESPGATTFLLETALRRWEGHYQHFGHSYATGSDTFAAFWENKVTNYVAAPNLVNTCLPHLGEVVRVKFPEHRRRQKSALRHAISCVLATVSRGLSWMAMWQTTSAIASYIHLRKEVKRAKRAKRNIARWDVIGKFMTEREEKHVQGLMAGSILGAIMSGLLSGSLAVYYLLGRGLSTVRNTGYTHDLGLMIQAFDAKRGVPKHSVLMQSWPDLRSMAGNGRIWRMLRSLLTEAVVPMAPTSAGLHNLGRQERMMEARIKTIPGYIEHGVGQKRIMSGYGISTNAYSNQSAARLARLSEGTRGSKHRRAASGFLNQLNPWSGA
ncbi:unnamed protein product [Pedinophyceae sp. YPF-701]|nr:unnamed protein product [Pedinophyceae sp. YPF-701]